MEKVYKCECGKQFLNSQSFNGHKSHCKVHNISKYGNLEHITARELKMSATKRLKAAELRLLKSQEKELLSDNWQANNFRCATCGCILTSYYGSGKYCSRSCANSRRKSAASNSKTSNSLKLTSKTRYNLNPKFCAHCGIALSYELRTYKYCSDFCRNASRNESSKNPRLNNRECLVCGKVFNAPLSTKTCSRECGYKLLSAKQSKNYQEHKLDHITVKSKYKYGTYAGVYCDSSWELAFVIYLLDHNIDFKRNTDNYFTYTYKGNQHNFFPDFIVGNTYVELKNRHSDLTDAKISAIPPHIDFKILYYEDIKPILSYISNKYGSAWQEMYDRNFPCWLDN